MCANFGFGVLATVPEAVGRRDGFLSSVLSTHEPRGYTWVTEASMNEDVFNGSIRKFLKTLGVSAQREIEKAVRQAIAEGKLKGNESFPAKATVTISAVGLAHQIEGEIELDERR